jgi:hypothetical protein
MQPPNLPHLRVTKPDIRTPLREKMALCCLKDERGIDVFLYIELLCEC